MTDECALSLAVRRAYVAQETAIGSLINRSGFVRSNARYAVLRTLHLANSRGLTQTEIAKTLDVTATDVTHLLRGLEETGLICRTPHATDHRAITVRLTTSGEDVCSTLIPEITGLMEHFTRAFTKDEQELFLKFLDRFGSHAVPSNKAVWAEV